MTRQLLPHRHPEAEERELKNVGSASLILWFDVAELATLTAAWMRFRKGVQPISGHVHLTGLNPSMEPKSPPSSSHGSNMEDKFRLLGII